MLVPLITCALCGSRAGERVTILDDWDIARLVCRRCEGAVLACRASVVP